MILLATNPTAAAIPPPPPATGYIIAVVAIMFVITYLLRALPFAILAKLRDSTFVNIMALWMPAGILGLLAIVILYTTATDPTVQVWKLLVAVAVTIACHLLLGRRTLVSVGLGTVTYVVLVNFLA